MYRLGQNRRTHRKLFVLLACLLLLIVLAVVVILHLLRANPDTTASGAINRQISYDDTKYQTFTTPLFTISLPADWKAVSPNSDVPTPSFTWQGTVGDNRNRWVSVYIDENVSTLAVNRALEIQVNGSTVLPLGDVSENCITYTGGAAETQGHATTAKWQGISFLCDSGNYERDVVGIVSQDGLNNITLGGTQGSHHVFFTYTDNAVSADYTIFIKALRSIRLR